VGIVTAESNGYIIPVTDKVKNLNSYIDLITCPPRKIEKDPLLPLVVLPKYWNGYIVLFTCLPKNCNGSIVLFACLQKNCNGSIVLVTYPPKKNWNGYIVLVTCPPSKKIVTATLFTLQL
jgi:hypothetical protein